jgi:hypothetical protein
MGVAYRIEVTLAEDGQWKAWIDGIPGSTSVSDDRATAIDSTRGAAIRILLDRQLTGPPGEDSLLCDQIVDHTQEREPADLGGLMFPSLRTVGL